MASLPFIGRSYRTITLTAACVALGLALSALVSRGPTARGSEGTWEHCTAGTGLADSIPSAAHGVFVAGPNQLNRAIGATTADIANHQALFHEYLPADPTICGFSLVIPWSSIDKGPSYGAQQYDFSTYLDPQVQAWTTNTDGTSNGKIVNLIVWGADESADNAFGGTVGSDGSISVAQSTPSTPAYVLAHLKAETPSQIVPTSVSGCSKGDPTGTPVYWDPDSYYQSNWQAFQKALVNYVGSTASYAADIGYLRFGIGAGGEDFPEDQFDDGYRAGTGCWKVWHDLGLTAVNWLTYSEAQITFEASLGSNLPLIAPINAFPEAVDEGLSKFYVPDGLAQFANTNGMGMMLGMQGMTSGELDNFSSDPASCYADWCSLFTMYRGKMPLEAQDLTESCPTGGGSGPTGSLPDVLAGVVTTAGVQVLEIWPQDWLIADDVTWPGLPGCSSSYSLDHTDYATSLATAACEVGGQGGTAPSCPPRPPPPSPRPSCAPFRCT